MISVIQAVIIGLVLSLSGTVWAATATLTWTDNATNETSFSIERQEVGLAPFVEVGTTAANVVTYTDTTLAPGKSYCYRVKAANAAGKSGPSNAACTISVPTELRITVTE